MSEDHSTPEPADGREQGEPRFSFTDKRKVNPEDGSVRPPAEPGGEDVDPIDAEAAALFEEAASGPADARVAELEQQVAELSETLKRDQAEYVNSRRRIEASAEAGRQAAVAGVLTSLIGVLDDIDLGRQHGDIVEGTPFHAISQKLESVLATHGLERFGAVGDEFDPNVHEALMHEDSEEVEVNTVKMVMQPGYRMNGRVLRPARVATYGPQ